MPYHVAQSSECPASRPWAVMGPNGSKGCHPTKEAAERQMAALYANEPGLAEMGVLLGPVALVEYRGQPRDPKGRWAPNAGGVTGMAVGELLRFGGGRTAAAEIAVGQLRAGQQPSVMAGEVQGIMEYAAGISDHPDLTELRVEGTLKFGGDGLGIARKEMPQLPEGTGEREQFFATLKDKGVSVEVVSLDPRELRPMQKEISAQKAGQLYVAMEQGQFRETNHLTITADNYVLDGHHRWAAKTAMAFATPTTILCDRIGLTAMEAFDFASEWTQEAGIATKAMGEARLSEHLPGKHDQRTHGTGAAVAAVTRDVRQKGGGTFEPGTGKRIVHGTVVGRPGYSASFDRDQFLADPEYRRQAVTAYLRDKRDQFETGGKFGVWDSGGEGGTKIVFDVVDVVSRAEGERLGRERGEDGVFDLDAPPGQGYIPTGGKTYT
jgi:hypothetical protein